ncbi:MAG: hypothetical protein J2P45_03685 [Candidatus Dormibacteraeota bacterium]|nr:hypothetical protein [Candidatus Dormibacteraeota bacterium]
MGRAFAAAAAVMVLTAGCGSPVTVGSPSPTPRASTPPLATQDLADWDSGRSIGLLRGQDVLVELHQPVGYAAWASPQSTNSSVVAPQAGGTGTAPAGVTRSSFRASAVGTAELQATAQAVCQAGQACPAAKSWTVTIKVVQP